MRIRQAVGAFTRRIGRLFTRQRLERDLNDEIAFHRSMRQAEGGDPRRFGNQTIYKEQMREMWTFPSFESFWRDVRYALRSLRRQPGFTLAAVATLAIGIGANAAVFSLVDGVFLRGLPYPDERRLFVLIGNVQRAVVERRGGSYPDFLDWRAQSKSFDDLAAYDTLSLMFTGGDEPERVAAEYVSPAYFPVLGVVAARGRTFASDEDGVPGRNPVLIIGDGLWKRRFAGDPSIVGRKIALGARQFEVIGIMPPGFKGVTDTADAWIPYAMSGAPLDQRGSRGLQVLARLKANVSIDQSRAELAAISKRLEEAHPDTNEKRGVEISPLSVETFGAIRPVVGSLMAAVALVLLLACANVANLSIAKAETRRREIAVRTALGAGRGRLLRQLVTESAVLAVLSAAVGLGLAVLALQALVVAGPVSLPSFVTPGLNIVVVLYTLAVTGLCGVLVGLAPAAHARVGGLADALKDAARGSSGGSSLRLRHALMVIELALAVILLVGAGLLIRSVQNLTAVDPGFNPQDVGVVRLSVPRQAAPPPAAPAPGTTPPPPPPFVASAGLLLERVRAVPGVTMAALGSDTPLDGNSSAVFYTPEGVTSMSAQTAPRIYVHRVSPEFFATLGVPLRHGRPFQTAELTADSPAIIVSERVVQRFWPGVDPVGKRLKVGGPTSQSPWLSIVGVVPEIKYRGLPDNPTQDPDLYFPFVDRSLQSLVFRTSLPADQALPSIRAAIRAIDRTIVIFAQTTLEKLVADQTARSRFTAWTMTVFAGAALVLAVIGVYGVMSYLVTLRSREIGVRLAMGASPSAVARMILGNAGRLVAAGLVVGAGGAFALRTLLDTLLFGVSVTDISGLAAMGLLAVVAMVACLIPAIRAARLSPLLALRAE